MKWTRCPDAADLAATACERITCMANRAIEEREAFRLVLAGGMTPQACYRLLAQSTCDWHYWHIYFGDERCLPATDDRRNSVMAAHAWLDHVPIPTGQIHPIPGQLGPEEAARLYTETIGPAYPFDLVLLGLGEDGHTASLFPGQDYPLPPQAIAIHEAPKPPRTRVSLNPAALSSCRQLLFLVSGKSKRQAVARWRHNQGLPAADITSRGGIEALVEHQAWGELPA